MVQAMFDLTGRKALVTGASRGLGYSMAEVLLEAGAEAVIVGKSDHVHSAANHLAQSTGGKVHPLQIDLGKREELQKCFNDALEILEVIWKFPLAKISKAKCINQPNGNDKSVAQITPLCQRFNEPAMEISGCTTA